MLDIPVESFTAQQAADEGLIEAIKRGEVKITGSYELTTEGILKYQQNNFVFKDRFGKLRCGKFKEIFYDIAELNKFLAIFLSNNSISSNE